MEPSWPSLNRRSIFSIPEAEEARTVPLGACDSEGDLGEAVISLAIPGKAVSHHPLRLSIPLPDQNRARTKLYSLLVKAGQTGGRYRPSFLRNRSVQHLLRLGIEIAKTIGLDSIGDDREQQMPCQMSGRRPLEYALPACVQSFEIETAQMRDLVLNRRLGRGTTIVAF